MVKQSLLGNPLGRAALYFRDKLDLLRSSHFSVESVGTIANDQLATTLITQICGSYKTFIDVGAHIGSVIAQVKHTDPTVKIVAIEAIPEKVENLRSRFPYVELHGCAVGETDGEISFFVDTRQSGYSSLARPDGVEEKSKIEIKVPIAKLDSLVNAADVDAIKVDVEGAELGVLRGATRMLQACRPIIMFESGPTGNNGLGYTKEAMLNFLNEINFCVVVPNRLAHDDDGLSVAGFVESHLYPRRTTNYFAVPTERRAEFRQRARSILKL
jgi:FkbM family methyltransferase